MTTRRGLLKATAGSWLLGQLGPAPRSIPGSRKGASFPLGHLLRGPLPADLPNLGEERADVVIVGGGIAGLSAAWRLAPLGISVTQLELEPFLGGTSASGHEGAVPHPWGAHYLPVPNPEARAALRLLEQMGTLQGFDAAGRPRFDSRVLCHDPEERLFFRGSWHRGLVPHEALDQNDKEELTRFSELTEALTRKRGRDGRFVFQIPLAESSRDPEFLALDKISMRQFLLSEGYRSEFLHWYVRYATLDDFGADPDCTSAWAGLHYFTARKLKTPELSGSHFLVWPEGNGRLVKELADRGNAQRRLGMLVHQVIPEADGVRVIAFDSERRGLLTFLARAVVLAVPDFVARRLTAPAADLPVRNNSPWLVANLHVERPIDLDAAWDSVIYDGLGLGYVDAAHQLTPPRESTVLTYFRAYGASDAASVRRKLQDQSFESLAQEVLADLSLPHPELSSQTSQIELIVWGHAMPRPTPGFLRDGQFEPRERLAERVAWGHADVFGMGLFEESQRAGVRAAEIVAADLGLPVGESWT